MGDLFGEHNINRLMAPSMENGYNQLEDKIDLLLKKCDNSVDDIALLKTMKQELNEMKVIILNVKTFNFPGEIPTPKTLDPLKMISHNDNRMRNIRDIGFPGNNTLMDFNNKDLDDI